MNKERETRRKSNECSRNGKYMSRDFSGILFLLRIYETDHLCWIVSIAIRKWKGHFSIPDDLQLDEKFKFYCSLNKRSTFYWAAIIPMTWSWQQRAEIRMKRKTKENVFLLFYRMEKFSYNPIAWIIVEWNFSDFLYISTSIWWMIT